MARSPHFTIYSQAGEDSARSALLWFESLRAFFLSGTDFKIDDSRRVFIVGFRSAQDYAPYRLHETADAFYVGEEGRDYIVLPALSASNYSLAAHEYAHLALHGAGLHLPFWFGEGLAEYLSTIRIAERRSDLGGDLPTRSSVLAHNMWLPIATVLTEPNNSNFHNSRHQADLFYSESWLLVDMLLRAPAYAPEFSNLLKLLASDTPSEQALTTVYAKPIGDIASDLTHWLVTRDTTPISMPGVSLGETPIAVADASPAAPREIVAQLLLASGDLGRAKRLYLDLERDEPNAGDVSAALASIALIEKDPEHARAEWQRAVKSGITDAALCVRFASTADSSGVDPDEVHQALQLAITLDPALDDCRYRLALSAHNTGDWKNAIAQLRAMHTIPPQRAFAYWITMASSYEGLDQRDEMIAAARQALDHAENIDQRAFAHQMILMGRTDLRVRLTRDSSGHETMETTRIPHGSKDWNPFIEPGETVRYAEGTLARVQCAGILTGLMVDTPQGELVLKVTDPQRVQLKNAPSQLTCGEHHSGHIRVEYVLPGSVLKGLEFLP